MCSFPKLLNARRAGTRRPCSFPSCERVQPTSALQGNRATTARVRPPLTSASGAQTQGRACEVSRYLQLALRIFPSFSSSDAHAELHEAGEVAREGDDALGTLSACLVTVQEEMQRCLFSPFDGELVTGHMEVPKQGAELELKLLAFTTATARWYLHHSSCPIPDPRSED